MRRPKGKIPCLLTSSRVIRTRVRSDMDVNLKEWRAEVPTGATTTGLLYLSSQKIPPTCQYQDEMFHLIGIRMDGTLVFDTEAYALLP